MRLIRLTRAPYDGHPATPPRRTESRAMTRLQAGGQPDNPPSRANG